MLSELLSSLRFVTASLREAAGAGEPTDALHAQRLGLEIDVRRLSRRTRAGGTTAAMDVAEAIVRLDDRVLLEFAVVDGVLHAVTVVDGDAQLHSVGPVGTVAEAVEAMCFALVRLNRDRVSDASRRVALDTLHSVGSDLANWLVPYVVADPDRPLVVVPSAALHGLPWHALERMHGRVVHVAPSLLAWALADQRREVIRSDAPPTLIAGPDLLGAEVEVAALGRLHPGAVVLDPAGSTVAACLEALAGTSLAHFACHGRFRDDNPLFSALQVADGDLTVFDLERCEHLPTTVILSACEAALSAELRGGALLGLANALIGAGVSTVVAPLTPISDVRSVEMMSHLHTHLVAGRSPAAALSAVTVRGGVLDVTAASFVAFGA
jgi:hypothetical protein